MVHRTWVYWPWILEVQALFQRQTKHPLLPSSTADDNNHDDDDDAHQFSAQHWEVFFSAV